MVGRPNAIKSGGRGSPPCATALKRQLHNRKWHRSRLWSLELAGSSRDGSAMCTPARAGPSTSSRIHHPWMLLWTDTGEEYQHDYCAYVLAYDEEGPRSRAMCAVADEGWGCQPSPARDFAVSLHCRRGDAPVVRGVSRRTNRQGGKMSQPHVETIVPSRSGGRGSASEASCKRGGPPVARVSIALVQPGESPRSTEIDKEHVSLLAGIEGALPPILVHRSSMKIIDGRHRLLAALARGEADIDVVFFDGSAKDAFLRSVESNTRHGLPLSLADRRAAAGRIVTTHSHMSDRAIAKISGLGAKAVAAIRARADEAGRARESRVGQDGRARPLDHASGRLRAAQAIEENPAAPLREIARLAGVSPSTAGDVRRRIEAGEEPVSARQRPGGVPPDGPSTTTAEDGPGIAALDRMLRDPSLRMKEDGRFLLRLLHENAAAVWPELSGVVPPHWVHLVEALARRNAANWLEFARRLEGRK